MKKEQVLKELNEVKNLLKDEWGNKYEEEFIKYKETMGFFNMFYVLDLNYNAIKFICSMSYDNDKGIIIEWNNDYTFYKLILNDGNNDIEKYIEKNDILNLINIIEEVDFFNIEDKEIVQLDGGSCRLEIKINDKYNCIEDYFYNKNAYEENLNKIIYTLLKLSSME
jgi:hypothetical protein